ncbi:MAG: hypothetical protein ACK56I_26915, partial [bacterium]
MDFREKRGYGVVDHGTVAAHGSGDHLRRVFKAISGPPKHSFGYCFGLVFRSGLAFNCSFSFQLVRLTDFGP